MEKIEYVPREDEYRRGQYNSVVTKINRWEKRYKDEPEKVLFLVEDALIDTRSPGKIAAYKDWLQKQANLDLDYVLGLQGE